MRDKHDKFNYLLIVLIFLFLVLPIVSDKHLKFPVISLVYLSALLIALGPFIKSRHGKAWFSIVACAAFLLELLRRSEFFIEGSSHKLTTSVVIHVIFLAMTLYILSRELFREKEVTADAIKGGICIYILIGILWGFMYSLAYHFDGQAFSAPLTREEDVF